MQRFCVPWIAPCKRALPECLLSPPSSLLVPVMRNWLLTGHISDHPHYPHRRQAAPTEKPGDPGLPGSPSNPGSPLVPLQPSAPGFPLGPPCPGWPWRTHEVSQTWDSRATLRVDFTCLYWWMDLQEYHYSQKSQEHQSFPMKTQEWGTK